MIKINPFSLNTDASAVAHVQFREEKSEHQQAAQDRFEKSSDKTEEKIGSEVQGSKKSKKKSSLAKNTELAEQINAVLDSAAAAENSENPTPSTKSQDTQSAGPQKTSSQNGRSQYSDWKNKDWKKTYGKQNTYENGGNRWKSKQYSPKMDPAVMGSPSEYFNEFLPNLMKRAGIQYPPELMQAQQEMMNHSYRFSLMQQEVQMQQAALNTHLQILNGIMQMNLDVFQSQNKNLDTIISARQKVYAMNNKTFATMFQNTMAVAEAWMTALTTTPRL
jgi:hypothetical protein